MWSLRVFQARCISCGVSWDRVYGRKKWHCLTFALLFRHSFVPLCWLNREKCVNLNNGSRIAASTRVHVIRACSTLTAL